MANNTRSKAAPAVPFIWADVCRMKDSWSLRLGPLESVSDSELELVRCAVKNASTLKDFDQGSPTRCLSIKCGGC